MKLIGKNWVTVNKKGELWTNIRGKSELIVDNDEAQIMFKLKRVFASKRYNDEYKQSFFNNAKQQMFARLQESDMSQEQLAESDRIKLTSGCQKLIDFFSEFGFNPNFRFVNTFAKALQESRKFAKSYIANYFALIDNNYKTAITDKLTSLEFSNICVIFENAQVHKQINNRFAIYYGSQGTGKTTLAMKEANNNCMVCHSAMLPSDLMEDFKFENGQPTFRPSALWNAITNGNAIVLDEINLLPFESLRFLQSILDGKKMFTYKGQLIEIADGFKIIGTMNLEVNGMTYALPEPLVDRAMELREFKLTAEQLLGALI